MLTNLFDYLRMALYATLIVLVLILYQVWEKDHPPTALPTSTPTISNNYVPEVVEPKTTGAALQSGASATSSSAITTGKIIHVKTDTMDISIDTLGGNIKEVKLLHYDEELHSNTPYLLLNNATATRYIAESGLVSSIGPDTKQGQAIYTTDQTDFVLPSNQNEMQVALHWQNPEGVKITKVFTLKRNSYVIDVSYNILNQSNKLYDANLYFELLRTNTPPVNHHGFVNATYFGAAISSPEKRFQKIPFSDMTKSRLNQTITGGWAAMIQHYFVSAWVPDKNVPMQYFTNVTTDGLYTIGMMSSKVNVSPNETLQIPAKFYAGPAIAEDLESAAPGLKLTIDYGWFWFISAIIFWMMQKIYNVIGNWGWSIVIVTLIIKLLFYHLSAKSYRSMSAMKKLQPRLTMLKERYGDDKQKFTQATLELYKKEKVNPMSGCLPILVQIPVFIGLYWVLIESVQLRQAPWILWIQDLSTKDPYYVLPVLMGLSMFLSQRLNPPPPDPMQAKVMMLMPVIFTALFINFPAGLMLYWFVNNTLSFLQQWYIMRSMEKASNVKK